MKVRNTLYWPRTIGRTLVVLSVSLVILLGIFISSAGALTRAEVIGRANSWVKRRVPYSQRSYYRGYRKDCSGFVSMAWRLNRSYTTRTISSKARRISISSLRPGDAVLRPGRHVSIFGGWKNKARREYIAIEQTTWGSHAKRHVRRIPRRAVALRRKGIIDRRRVVRVASRPKPRPVARPTGIAIMPVASVPASATPSVVAASIAQAIASLPEDELAALTETETLKSTGILPTLVPQNQSQLQAQPQL